MRWGKQKKKTEKERKRKERSAVSFLNITIFHANEIRSAIDATCSWEYKQPVGRSGRYMSHSRNFRYKQQNRRYEFDFHFYIQSVFDQPLRPIVTTHTIICCFSFYARNSYRSSPTKSILLSSIALSRILLGGVVISKQHQQST